MSAIRSLIAAILLPLALAGCAGLIAAGSATGAASGALALVDRISGVFDTAVAAGCQAYTGARVAANAAIAEGTVGAAAAAKIAAIEKFGDAACATPPPGDPLQTAIWLGRLVGQIITFASSPAGASG